MKKIFQGLATLSLATSLLASPISSLQTVQAQNQASHVQLNQQKVSLGASLNAQEIQRTLEILGATQVPSQDRLMVDGVRVNNYLRDGSNQHTGVYSSAIIEPRDPGYGVQVQILTPQTIQQVTAQTYQSAAITSGAKDVLIKIASVVPVTGEGALAGVYAIYEANGAKLNLDNIQVAQKEVTLPQSINLTDAQVNELTANIKTAISREVQAMGAINEAKVQEIVNQEIAKFEQAHQVKISEESKKIILSLMQEFARLEVADLSRTIQDSNPEAWTYQQAIDLLEGAVLNPSKSQESPMIANYGAHQWEGISRNGTQTLLKYGDVYYRFSKYDTETVVLEGTQPDTIEQTFTDQYTINHNTLYLISQTSPWLMPADGTPLDHLTVVDYVQKALYPNSVDKRFEIWENPDQDGAYCVVVDQQLVGGDMTYLASYKVSPNGYIDPLDNQAYSGYNVTTFAGPYQDRKNQQQGALAGHDSVTVTAQPQGQAYWNEARRELLKQYMNQWGQEMTQVYEENYPGQEGWMYGPDFPSEVLPLLAVNGNKVNAYWSYDGISQNPGDYAIVAAYNDQKDASIKYNAPAGAHFYLFALVDGQPVVLYSGQNQGQPDGWIHFKPTDNVPLSTAFDELIRTGTISALN